MAPLTLIAGTLLVVVLTACNGTPADRPASEPEPSIVPTAGTEQPHFVGDLPVTLKAGLVILSDDDCGDVGAEGDRICDETTGRGYLVLGDGVKVHLVEAETDVARGGLSWTAWLRFDRADADKVVRAREMARETGARVLVTVPGPDGSPQMLVGADVPEIEGRVMTFTHLDKPDAWDVVRRVVEAR